KDGTLFAALRGGRVPMHFATSRDLGLTWSAVKDIGFPAHCPHFSRLSTGEILLTHRLPATSLHVSRDEAKTWQGPYKLDDTPGGIGTFLLGFALACAGAWLLTDQVVVSGDYFASGFMLPIVNHRMNSFGLSLIPFIIGIGFLFFDGKSLIGWLLTIAGLVII